MMEPTWILACDVQGDLTEVYNRSISQGHSHEAALANAAAFLAVNSRQIAVPSVALGLVEILLNGSVQRRT